MISLQYQAQKVRGIKREEFGDSRQGQPFLRSASRVRN